MLSVFSILGELHRRQKGSINSIAKYLIRQIYRNINIYLGKECGIYLNKTGLLKKKM